MCDFDKSSKAAYLQKMGLLYGKDYLYEEDFFQQLDEMDIPNDRRTAVWGTGTVAEKMMCQPLSCRPELFIDSYKSQDFFMGYPVFAPEQITEWRNYFVIIAVTKDEEIRQFLLDQGLTENVDFAVYQKVIGRPSDLLRRTIFDQSCYDLACNTMLNHLEVFSGGDTRCCCTTFVEYNLDNIFEKNAEKLWHSNLHKIMCLSTENRTYTFCDKNMCPLFVGRKHTKHIERKEQYRQMSEFPKVLAIGHDSSCNLSCGTCRKEVHFAKGREAEKVKQVTEKIMKEYLPNCRFLILAGDGEVFASPAYRSIYQSQECNPDYIRILSNGTLFTPENWRSFSAGKQGKIMLTVSVDAAGKETYEKIRKNGSFESLKKNMEFASTLRKSGDLCYFRLNFVVQRDNYREMIPFVQWGEALGADEVFFTKILNWGTYTPEEFEQISMMEEDQITPKAELKEVLNHPAMKSKIVDLGTIQYAHKTDEIDVVENYYMWELEKRGGKLFD